MKKINLFVLTLMLVCVLGFTNIVSAENVATTQVAKGDSIYTLVASTDDLEAGEYIIANEAGTAFLGANSGAYYTSVDSISSSITWSVTLDSNNYFAFMNVENEKYLSYTGSDNNAYESDELSDTGRWTLSFNDDMHIVMANVGDSSRALEYNSSSPRFACYTGGQLELNLYKKTDEYTDVNKFQDITAVNSLNFSYSSEYSTETSTVSTDYSAMSNGDVLNLDNAIAAIQLGLPAGYEAYTSGTGTTPKYYTIGYSFRLYSNTSLTITVPSYITVSSITVNTSQGNTYSNVTVDDNNSFTLSSTTTTYITSIEMNVFGGYVYTVSDTQLRFGLQVSEDLYDSLAATAYGIEYTNNAGDVKEVALISSLTDGIYTMSAVFEIPAANIASDVTVRFYAIIDGEKIYTDYKTASVASVASAYTTMADPSDEVVAAMGALSYLSKITA